MTTTTSPVAARWDDLIQAFSCPDWFRDAKFGVWSHWGPQALPGKGDWYARYMYMPGHESYRHHWRTYGHPSKFGFKDICHLWKAEKFDAEALMDLYARNGAKYFMGQAAHCDNFDNFNSKHHRWNSVNVGPKRDILGEFAKAARAQGLRFGMSEHLVWSYSWFNTNKGADTTGPFAGVPYDGNDPANEDFYWEKHDDHGGQYPHNPSAHFINNWKARLMDAIDQYEPDIFYTDGGIPFETEGLELMAYFYNKVLERTGRYEGVYNYKDVNGRRPGANLNIGVFKPGAGVEDLEHGVLGEIMPEPWQTDTSSGPWYWNPTVEYKSPGQIVHMLADIVAKNGNLLLNYTQRPDGSLDEETTWIVEEVGAWLRTNGEAIYGTRPWTRFGEGGANFEAGEMSIHKPIEFGAGDFRFTTKGDVLYATSLGRPAANDAWRIGSVADRETKSVTLLGYDGKLEWQKTPEGLKIAVPADLGGAYAWSFKIE